ncbi:MAG: helix-turn-helix transcriptional regulator [Pseudomonadota bacterium]
MGAERARKLASKPSDDPTKDLRRRFGRWLKLRREERGVTQADLAGLLGLKYYSFISQVENGLGRIPQSLYGPWAKALGIDDEEFAWMALSHLEPGLFQMLRKTPPPDPTEPIG